MLIGTIAIVLALELGIVGWPASSLRRLLRPKRSELTDLLLFTLFISGFAGLAITVCSLGLSTQIAHFCAVYLSRRPFIDTGSDILNCALYLVAADFATYWLHRAQHMKPLWWFHKLHHSAERLNPLVLHRVNPADLTFNALPKALALLAAAPSPAILAGAAVILTFHSLLIHTTIPWRFGRLGSWFLISPSAHQIHHSFEPHQFNRNFGSILPVWDRIFGTWLA